MSDAIDRYRMSDALIRNLEQVNRQSRASREERTGTTRGPSFQELLQQQLERPLSFSRHAAQRTEQRNIQLTPGDLERLGTACSKAEQKGIRDALVVMNDAAFIINASSRTVITALDKNEMKENVFTHIDGALFL